MTVILQPRHVIGGECLVSRNPNTVYMTVLGSCVCACVYDPMSAVGGINHFVLPYGAEQASGDAANRYGEVAMRNLIDGLVRFGAKPERLVAKLYGGRTSGAATTGAGILNADFAKQFLRDEGIPLLDAKLGGQVARWVTFKPTTGEVEIREAAEPAKSFRRLPQKYPGNKIAC